MHSVVAGVAVAAVITFVALYKGRTGWHWFALSLFAFAAIWGTSFGVLYVANVRLTLGSADRALAEFSAAVTATVIVIVLAWLPHRPRPHSAPPVTAERRGPSA
jgi:hypothetical protein